MGTALEVHPNHLSGRTCGRGGLLASGVVTTGCRHGSATPDTGTRLTLLFHNPQGTPRVQHSGTQSRSQQHPCHGHLILSRNFYQP